MGASPPIEMLSASANLLRESLQKSEAVTGAVVSKLGSFVDRLAAIDSAVLPTQVRISAIAAALKNVDKALGSTGAIEAQFDLLLQAEDEVRKGPHNDLKSYLEAVEQLRSVIRFFRSNKTFIGKDGALSRANGLLVEAIVKMEVEFEQLLSKNSKPVDLRTLYNCLPSYLRPLSEFSRRRVDSNENPSSINNSEDQVKSLDTATYTLPTLLPEKILPPLHDLVLQMIQARRHEECFTIYTEARMKALEESLKQLQEDRSNKYGVQSLEQEIENWIHAMRIAVKLLFAGERKLCDEIFDGFDSLKDHCFAAVTANSVVKLLSSGEDISKSKRSPERLFVLLDMYEIMSELQPEIQTIFKGKSCSGTRESAMRLIECLAQTSRETFGDFEQAVEKDTTKTAVLDGTVHPLTSYVINYVKYLIDYQSTLKQLFQEFETEGETNSKFTCVTMRILQALQNNLEQKSKQYKDPALSYLFLMNNIHYMVRSVSRSEAKDFLGDDWIQRHRRIVQQSASQYRRVAWAKILQSLSPKGLGLSGGCAAVGREGYQNSTPGISKAAVKERFKSFTMQFEELLHRQSQWTVPDPELKESLRLAVAEVLLPAYRSFIKRFGPLFVNGKDPKKYIKYTPEDIEMLLGHFFESANRKKP